MGKILLLLADGFEAYEASVFTDIIGFSKNGGFDVELESVGLHTQLSCAYGFAVVPNKLLAEITLSDYSALAFTLLGMLFAGGDFDHIKKLFQY